MLRRHDGRQRRQPPPREWGRLPPRGRRLDLGIEANEENSAARWRPLVQRQFAPSCHIERRNHARRRAEYTSSPAAGLQTRTAGTPGRNGADTGELPAKPQAFSRMRVVFGNRSLQGRLQSCRLPYRLACTPGVTEQLTRCRRRVCLPALLLRRRHANCRIMASSISASGRRRRRSHFRTAPPRTCSGVRYAAYAHGGADTRGIPSKRQHRARSSAAGQHGNRSRGRSMSGSPEKGKKSESRQDYAELASDGRDGTPGKLG